MPVIRRDASTKRIPDIQRTVRAVMQFVSVTILGVRTVIGIGCVVVRGVRERTCCDVVVTSAAAAATRPGTTRTVSADLATNTTSSATPCTTRTRRTRTGRAGRLKTVSARADRASRTTTTSTSSDTVSVSAVTTVEMNTVSGTGPADTSPR